MKAIEFLNSKKWHILVILILCSYAQHVNGQWSTLGNVVYPTDTAKKISIGTKSNSADLYVYRNNASATVRVRSLNGNAILTMDKGNDTANSSVAYKAFGVTTWNSGMLGNNNYSIKNVVDNNIPLIITQINNVGIGTITPFFKLDVKGGSINTDSLYRINGNAVLSANGSGNIFAGFGSGIANTNGYNNSSVGVNALRTNSEGSGNTACGHHAMYWNTTGMENSACGTASLFSNTSGTQNTANGKYSLFYNTIGNNNTGIGMETLLRNVAGNNGVAIGAYSQNNVNNLNTSWDNTNTSIGYQSLRGSAIWSSNTGINNTAIGRDALFSNKTGNDNTAVGYQALYLNSTGVRNTAIGNLALYSNTTGYDNTAYGYKALYSNTSGIYNTAFGIEAMFANTTGYENTANGYEALYNNTTGYYNLATGFGSLFSNTSGTYNSSYGNNALFDNIDGDQNTAFGTNALNSNISSNNNSAHGTFALYYSTGGNNTAIGQSSLYYNTTGSNNSALGYNSGIATPGNLSNTTAIGANALVSLSNCIVFGDAAVTKWGFGITPVAANIFQFQNSTAKLTTGGVWTNASDKKLKDGFEKLNKAEILAKINQLEIERWHYKLDQESITHIGPIAQNFYELFKTGDDTTISTIDPAGVALIGIQELTKKINSKDLTITNLQEENILLQSQLRLQQQQLEALKDKMNQFENDLSKCCANNESLIENKSTKVSGDTNWLEQNQPNPFHEQTIVRYVINSQFSSALLHVSDNNHRVLKTEIIKQSGRGEFIIYAAEFTAGTYQYSLIVDGKVVDTKQMVLTK